MADSAQAALPAWCDTVLQPTASGDRTADIQAALDAGSGSPSNLHWVCLKNGTYPVSGPLQIKKSYVGFRGDTSTTIRVTAGKSAVDFLKFVSRTKIKIQYMTIDTDSNDWRYTILSSGSNDVELTSVSVLDLDDTHGVGIYASSNVRLNGGTIHHVGGAQFDVHDAVWTYGSSGVKVRFVTVQGAADGPGGDGSITCYDTDDYLVQGVLSWNAGSSSFYTVNCSQVELRDNLASGSSEWGLDIVGGTHDGILHGNTIQNNLRGAMIVSDAACGFPGCQTKDIDIYNNQMQNNNSSGIGTCASINVGTTTSNIQIYNNTTNQPPVWCWR